jgi:hypothetical protein
MNTLPSELHNLSVPFPIWGIRDAGSDPKVWDLGLTNGRVTDVALEYKMPNVLVRSRFRARVEWARELLDIFSDECLNYWARESPCPRLR